MLKKRTFSEEHRRKLSAALKGRKLSEAHKKNVGLARIGYVHSEETKVKIAEGNRGQYFSPERRKAIGEKHSGVKSHWWKGGTAYSSIHLWVRRTLGTPNTCKHCGATGLIGRKINWSNKDHKYQKNPDDWQRLCRKCHWAFDNSLADIIADLV